MQEMSAKDLEEIKNKQAEMNNTLEGIISRITYVKEQISDLEDRTLEITATEQNTEKKQWGKKKRRPKNNLQPSTLRSARLLFKFDEEIKSFTEKQNLREFSTTKPALQQILKELFQSGNARERKDLQQINPIGNRIINIDNHLNCEWIKCTNQKTYTGWVDENI